MHPYYSIAGQNAAHFIRVNALVGRGAWRAPAWGWTSWGCRRHASNLQRLWSTHADQGVLVFALLPHCVNLMR